MNTETMHEDDVEVEVGGMLELLDGNGALAAVDRASMDVQIMTAKANPRSVTAALREAKSLATRDEQTAESMFYVLPRAGKRIEGPSARLAEIMAYSWENLRAEADIVAEDRTHVTAMGTCFDLQKNVAVRVRVKRRITNSRGERFNEDMIGVTSNAAISIALRNAVFKVIPQVYVNEIYRAARKASIGKGGTTIQKRQNALAWFAKVGVKEEQVFALLGIKGVEDMGEDELIALRGLRTAIKDGETTVEQAFRRHDVSDGAGELNEALGEKPKAEKPEPPKDGELPPDEKVDASLAELEKIVGVDVEQRAAIIEELDAGDPEKDPRAYKAYHERLSAMVDEANA